MSEQKFSKARGERLKLAINIRGVRKAIALAVELNISAAAVTKWIQGHSMSVENACNIANALDISLDWLLLGRNGPDWLRLDQLSDLELDLIGKIRERPTRIIRLLITLTNETPKIPATDRADKIQPPVK